MSDIDIQVKATSDLKGLSDATTAVKDLGDAGTAAGGDGSSAGMSWAAAAVGEFVGNLAGGIITQIPEIAGQLYALGKAAGAVASGFEAAGGSDTELEGLRDATKGLVSDTNLMSTATSLMRQNLSASVGTTQDIIRKGGEIGTAFSDDAATGVKDLGKAIVDVGNYKQITDLGGDADTVKKKFDDLKKSMSDKDAWGVAVMGEVDTIIKSIPDSLDNTHPAIERFGVAIDNFRDTAGKAFIGWLDDALGKVEDLFGWGDKVTQQQTDEQAVADVGTRHGFDIDQQDKQRAVSYYRTGAGGSSAYQSLVRTYGQERADEMIRSMGSRPAALDQIAEESGGFQPYYARYIPGYGQQQQPSAPAPSRHSSRSGDITGEGEGYGMYGDDSPSVPSTRTTGASAKIEKPTVTAAEFDAIVRSAGAASAATLAFGAAGAVAMGGLALSSAIAAGQIGNITTQGNGALAVLKQIEVQMKTMASISISVTSTRQAGGSGGDTTPARGPR